jgi:hypothetical protein
MKQAIGWREWVALPDIGIDRIKAKVDTGARTSALHAFSVEAFEENGRRMIRFGVHPKQRNTELEVWSVAPVKDVRIVRDSGGHEEERFVIETRVIVGTLEKPIEVTLTARDNMGFRMLLGRTALKPHFVVDPARSYLAGKRRRKERQ